VGGAGILVEPRDDDRLAAALRAAWADERVHRRLAGHAHERARGPRRTWADVAADTRRIYAEVGIRVLDEFGAAQCPEPPARPAASARRAAVAGCLRWPPRHKGDDLDERLAGRERDRPAGRVERERGAVTESFDHVPWMIRPLVGTIASPSLMSSASSRCIGMAVIGAPKRIRRMTTFERATTLRPSSTWGGRPMM
jgi:hypothetical protein